MERPRTTTSGGVGLRFITWISAFLIAVSDTAMAQEIRIEVVRFASASTEAPITGYEPVTYELQASAGQRLSVSRPEI